MKYVIVISGLMVMLLTSVSEANVKYPFPDSTRLYVEQKENNGYQEGYLTITNPGKKIWLVQSWLYSNGKKDFRAVIPFLSRLEAESGVALKIYYSIDTKLPEWIFVKLIPAKDSSVMNSITIPVVYKLKVVKRNVDKNHEPDAREGE